MQGLGASKYRADMQRLFVIGVAIGQCLIVIAAMFTRNIHQQHLQMAQICLSTV